MDPTSRQYAAAATRWQDAYDDLTASLEPLLALMGEALEAGVRYFTETDPQDVTEAGFARAMLTAVQDYSHNHSTVFIGTTHLWHITKWIECEADRYADHNRGDVLLGLLDSLHDFFGDSDALARATEHREDHVAGRLSDEAWRLYEAWQAKAATEVLASVRNADFWLKQHHDRHRAAAERSGSLLRAAGAL